MSSYSESVTLELLRCFSRLDVSVSAQAAVLFLWREVGCWARRELVATDGDTKPLWGDALALHEALEFWAEICSIRRALLLA